MRVVQVTDTHVPVRTGAPTVVAVLAGIDAGDPVQPLEVVLEHLAALDPAPDLLVGTGDLADAGHADSYERWADFFLPLGAPIWAMPGNHDLAEVLDETFAARGISTGVAHRTGDWLHLFPRTGNTEWGEMEPEQLEEARAALAASDAPYVFVWIHHPPLGNYVPAHDNLVREDVRALIDGDPRVRGIAAGHVHIGADLELDGIPVWLTPSTYTGRLGPGYRVFDLHDDGTVTTELHTVPAKITFTEEQREALMAMAAAHAAHQPDLQRGGAAKSRAEVERWREETSRPA